MVMNGFFSFEGIDGSGKTTQLKLFSHYLQMKGHDVVVCHEPGGTKIGEEIRKLLLNPMIKGEIYFLTELLLFNASRAQLIHEVILPSLKANKIILIDRYIDSTLAYQGYGRGINKDIIKNLNEMVTKNIKPLLTFLFVIDIETAKKRNSDAKKKDRFEGESIEFIQSVQEGYREFAKIEPKRFRIINADKSPQKINEEIINHVERLWLSKKS